MHMKIWERLLQAWAKEYILYNVTLQFLPSREVISINTLGIWASFVKCFDRQNVAVLTVYQCVPWPQEFFHFSSPLVPWHCHVYNPRIAYSNMRAHGGEPRYPSWGHQDQAIVSQLPDTCENPTKIGRAAYRTHSQCMSKASQEWNCPADPETHEQ